MSVAVIERLSKRFAGEIVRSHSSHGDETVVVSRDRLAEISTFLRDDDETAFEMLVDLTVVDYLGVRHPRFDVVIHLASLSKNHRLRIRVELEEGDPVVPSLVEVWKSALWMEREAFDLYGVRFEGHPDLRRILLYPEFRGHPLRKDYDIEARQPRIPPYPGRHHL